MIMVYHPPLPGASGRHPQPMPNMDAEADTLARPVFSTCTLVFCTSKAASP